MIIDASASSDLNGQPLKFRWVVLQGDPDLVDIETANAGRSARITFTWHPEQRSRRHRIS